MWGEAVKKRDALQAHLDIRQSVSDSEILFQNCKYFGLTLFCRISSNGVGFASFIAIVLSPSHCLLRRSQKSSKLPLSNQIYYPPPNVVGTKKGMPQGH